MIIRVAEIRTGQPWKKIVDCLGRMHRVTLATEHGMMIRRTDATTDQERVFRSLGIEQPALVERFEA